MTTESHIKLTKMQGTGNDFLIVEAWTPETAQRLKQHYKCTNLSEVSQKICARHYGVGADGLVLLQPAGEDSENEFEWDFYNSDGSRAEMCGNAARCVAAYAHTSGITDKTEFSFGTLCGGISARILSDDYISVTMTPVQWLKRDPLVVEGVPFWLVDTGVPHAVAQMDAIEPKALTSLCEAVGTRNPVFTPKGANLTFFRPQEEGHIQAVTFERGVDDFTLSCGTGAVAAAEVFKSQHAPNSSGLHIHVPGGKLLVDLRCEQPLLIGPALVTAEIHLRRS